MSQSTLSQVLPRFRAIATGNTSQFILKRVGQALITLALTSMLCFFIADLAPGNYLDVLRENPTITEDVLEAYKVQFGLDQPVWVQYGRWVGQILTQGDFGTSFVYQRSVTDLILERVPATVYMAIASLLLTWAIGIPLGILAAVNHNKWGDRILQTLSYIGQGFPSFIAALLLLLFAQNVSPLFPVGGMTSIDHNDLTLLGKFLDIGWHSILPVTALSLTGFAGLQRLMRGQLLDVLRQDYVRTARAKGLDENRVIYIHALRNAVNPLIVLLGFEFANLLSGAFITEYFFNWPGLGQLVLQAVQVQDLYLTMAGLMIGATMLIVGNLMADLMLKVVDPRIQLGDSD
ncbi:MAG: ABC transporter permease [Cyanophyceae cyanobacterium]